MKLYIAGHQGMVGAALVRRFKSEPDVTLVSRTRRELELTNQAAVDAFFATELPDVAIIAAAKVGGIHANNTYPADFIYDNMIVAANTIHAAHATGVKRLLFLGSSCIYPKLAPQPMAEDSLLTSALEPTNEAYAIAKIAGLKLCEAMNEQYGRRYATVMPTNLYGPGDNYDLTSSHVLPALIRKAHEAKQRGEGEIIVWGSGTPRRELLYVDDLAAICVFLMETDAPPTALNIGTGNDLTIAELVRLVMDVVGFEGNVSYDASKPDGTPQKLLDVSRLRALGAVPTTPLREGIAKAYASAPFYPGKH